MIENINTVMLDSDVVAVVNLVCPDRATFEKTATAVGFEGELPDELSGLSRYNTVSVQVESDPYVVTVQYDGPKKPKAEKADEPAEEAEESVTEASVASEETSEVEQPVNVDDEFEDFDLE